MAQAGKDASPVGGAVRYERHRPETTLLYQLVDAHYPVFADRMVAQGTPLPDHVQREFEDYLKCGRLEPGGLRANLTHIGVLGRKTESSKCPLSTGKRPYTREG